MSGFNVGIKDVLFGGGAAGGATLSILGLLSIFCVALIWERRGVFAKAMADLRRVTHGLRRILDSDGDMKSAVTLCKRKGPAASVLKVCLFGPKEKSKRRAAVDRALEREVSSLEKSLSALGTIGSIAPFVGLLGTVLGVIGAFDDLKDAATAGPGIVAGGISHALVATAAGLFVAIPAIIAYNYFTTRANRFSDEMRWMSDELLDHPRFSEGPSHARKV